MEFNSQRLYKWEVIYCEFNNYDYTIFVFLENDNIDLNFWYYSKGSSLWDISLMGENVKKPFD